MNGNTEEDIGASIEHVFDQFVTAVTCKTILSSFNQLLDLTGLRHADHSNFYEQLKVKLKGSWKAQSLWAKLDKRASHRDYKKQKACSDVRVLVIGSGPCGLRTAIECALLGAKTVLVEKRDRFSRNNVLHLWPYLITDLRNLGAKKFFGKFCAGAIDHISIRQLQCILLKVALLLGVEVHVNVTFEGLIEPPEDQSTQKGWHCKVKPENHVLSEYEINVLIGADGKRNTLPGFKRKEFRGKLAIAVTANFINRNTQAEARVEEISGVAFIFNQKFFLDLKEKTRIDLENIVYYKDDTHYFVMTAKKASLLEKGVLKEDYSDTIALLDRSNVNQEALMAYAKEAADFSTNYQLPSLEYAVNHYGQADVAMFDFTSMFAAENASRFLYKNGHHLLLGLVGDSLLEPFWPTGSGCARGFLGAFDAAWMIRSWANGRTPLQVLAERESIFTVLSQTTPNYLHKNHNAYSLDPNTRYPNLNLKVIKPSQVKHLYEGGVIEEKELEEEDLNTGVPSKKPRNAEPTIDSYTLLRWCQRVLNTGKYRDVHIVDFTSSWRSGLALCALIHSFRPEIISNTLLMECEVAANNQMAFNVAEKELGIPPVLTGEDMAKYEIPDKLTMVAYLSQFYELFKNEPLPSSIPLPVKSKRKSLSRDTKIPKSPRSPNRRTSFFQKLSAKIAKSKKRKEQEENEGVPLGSKKLKERQEKPEVELTRYNKLPMEEIANRLQLDRKIEDPRIKINKAEERSGAVSVTAMAEVLVAKFKNIEGKPPPELLRRMKGQPTLLAATAASEFCSFCHKRVYIMERMSAEGEFFHRGCLKCDHCGVGLRLTNYSCDRDTKPVKFYCYRHALPELRTRPQRKRGLDEESMETIPDMVITPPEEEDMGQASKEKSPRKAAPGHLTPLLMPKDGVEQEKNTPERVEFEISFDGCEEESEEEQFEHNLRASMSSDTLLDDQDYSDSDSDLSDCPIESDSDEEVWESALTLEEANELRGTWRRQHSQENLVEAVEKGHEYMRFGEVNGEEEGSSTEVEDGSEYETDDSSEEEDDDSTEEKTETSAKEMTSLKSPLSPVSKISASKANFFSEPPTVVSLDPWSMFGMGKKGAEDEDMKEAVVEPEQRKRSSSSKKRISTSSESKSERKKSSGSKRCASSKSTDVSESLELDQSEDKIERISAAGSLDDLKDLNADLVWEGEGNNNVNAVVANGRPLSVDSAQSLQQGSQAKLHSILKRASVDNMDLGESATAREMEKGSEGDDERFEEDDNDELLEKTAVSLAMEQLLRDMDKSSSKGTGYNNTSDSGENEVFVEGRLSPSAKKARKFRIRRHAKRTKERQMSRSSDSEAGRTDPTTTDNSLPRSPISHSPSTELEDRDDVVADKGSLGSMAEPSSRLSLDEDNFSGLDSQPTVTTEMADESLRKVFENIAAMPDLSESSDIDDLVLRNVDDRFVTDRRKRTKRRSKPAGKKEPSVKIDKEVETFSNTSFSISTPSSESESTVSSIEVDEFAGQILEAVPGEDDIKPDPEMLRDYTTTMSLALGESYSDSTADEEPQVEKPHLDGEQEKPPVDRAHEKAHIDREQEKPHIDRTLPAVVVNKSNNQASPEAESAAETTSSTSDVTLNSIVNVPPSNSDPLNTPHSAKIAGGRPLPIPRSLAPTPIPQPRKSVHSPTRPRGESTPVDTPTTPVNRESSGSEIFLSPLETLTQPPFVDQSSSLPLVKDEVTKPKELQLSTNSSTKSREPVLSQKLPANSLLVPSKQADNTIIASSPQPPKPHRKLPELSKLRVSNTEGDQPAMCSSPKLIPKGVSSSAADSKLPSHTQPKLSAPSNPTPTSKVPVVSNNKDFVKPISPPIFRPPGKTKVPLDKIRLKLGSSSDHAESDHESERKKKISADGIVIGGSVGDDIPFADESEAEEKFYTPCAPEKTDKPKFPPVSGAPKKIVFNSQTPKSNPPVLSAEQIKVIQKSELEKAMHSKDRPRIKSNESSEEVNGSAKKVSKPQREIATFETLSISDVPSDSDNRLSSLQTATSSATEGDHVLQSGEQKKKKKKTKTPKNKKSKKDGKDKSSEPDKKEKRRSLLSLILPDKTPDRGSKDNLLGSDKTPKGGDDASRGKSKTPKFKKLVDRRSKGSQEDLEKTPTVDSKKDLAICSVFHSEASNRQQGKGQLTVPGVKKTISVAPKPSCDDLSDSDESHISLVTMQKRRGEDLDERLARRMRKIQLKQQKQAEQKRLRMAQEIQRQLEEVEVRQRELEERGITVEKALRGDGPDGEDVDEGLLMSEWFNLVHEKNALLRYESELNVRAKELELEDRQARLELDFRERSKKPDSTKTEHDIMAEGSLLDELLDVVEQRNTLVAMLEEDRLREQKEDTDLKQMMAAKGFVLSPMSYDTRREREKLEPITPPL